MLFNLDIPSMKVLIPTDSATVLHVKANGVMQKLEGIDCGMFEIGWKMIGDIGYKARPDLRKVNT